MNGRSGGKRGGSGRDPGGFIAMPWSVLDCPAYAGLSHPARSLLWEIARQLGAANNGKLLASAAHLAKRGWSSNDVITRAKRELLDAGFIHETVKGQRPNRAGWYAVTWRALDKHPGYDIGASLTFERRAYARSFKNASLTPSHGAKGSPIAPSHGVEEAPPTPSHGAMRACFGPRSTPSHGDHLDMPSPALAAG